jgi:hypothetical protein
MSISLATVSTVAAAASAELDAENDDVVVPATPSSPLSEPGADAPHQPPAVLTVETEAETKERLKQTLEQSACDEDAHAVAFKKAAASARANARRLRAISKELQDGKLPVSAVLDELQENSSENKKRKEPTRTRTVTMTTTTTFVFHECDSETKTKKPRMATCVDAPLASAAAAAAAGPGVLPSVVRVTRDCVDSQGELRLAQDDKPFQLCFLRGKPK